MELKDLLKQFEGETLNEAVIATMVTALQEAFDKINDDHGAEVQALKESHAEAFATASDVTAERIKEAADEAVQAMLAENEQRFVQADQFERMQAVFSTVKQTFEANGFELVAPDAALTESLTKKTEAHADAIARLTESRKEVEALKESLQSANRALILGAVTKDLSDLQRDKLGALCEGLTFADDEAYKAGLEKLVESLQEASPGPAEGKRDLEDQKKKAAMGTEAGEAPATVPVGSGGTDKKEIDALKEAQAAEAAKAAELEALKESLGGLDPETCSMSDLKMRGLSIYSLPSKYRNRFYA